MPWDRIPSTTAHFGDVRPLPPTGATEQVRQFFLGPSLDGSCEYLFETLWINGREVAHRLLGRPRGAKDWDVVSVMQPIEIDRVGGAT